MILRRISAVFLLILFSWPARAAFDQFPPGARTGGLGLAFVALADDPTAVVENPAGLAFLARRQFSSFYSRPFGLKELETIFLSAGVPVRSVALGAGVHRFGFRRYHEEMVFFSLSRKFSGRFSVGITVFGGRLTIPGYWDTQVVGINGGDLFRLTSRLTFAGVIKNATHAALARGENLPQELSAGAAFKLGKSAILSFQVTKATRFSFSFRTGVEWTFFKRVILRSGFLTQPARFSAGFGVRFGTFQLDYAYLTHAVLGGTHQFSISIF